MTASDRWRRRLEAWAIPDELLDRVDESPYGWSQALWRRRSEAAQRERESPTAGIVERLLPPAGTVLDIGIGRGRASLPLAVADDVPSADVVMAANVAYNVQDIEPFLRAAIDHARIAVVLEVTDTHPWAHLAPLYREVHDLDRPDGPTADDLIDVIEEVTGRRPEVHRWERTGQTWYESWDELLDHYGRRLVVPRDERDRLRPILEPHVTEDEDGHLRIGDDTTQFATLVIRV